MTRMARYLVTGAQGFLGRYLAAALLEGDPGARVLGLGRSPRLAGAFTHRVTWGGTSVPAPLPALLARTLAEAEATGRYAYHPADLLDEAALAGALRRAAPDVVFHLASGLRGDPPRDLCRSCVEGTAALLQAVAAHGGAPRVVLGSSGAVYGPAAARSVPVGEDAACEPVEAYGAAKLAAEQVARAMARQAGLHVVYARIFNLTGPGQDERHVCGSFAARVAAIRRGVLPPALEVGDLDSTRDFLDVRDAAGALPRVAECARAGETVNVASGREVSVRAVLGALVAVPAGGAEPRVAERAPGPPPAVARHVACVARLSALGFRPAVPLERSLSDLMHYYLTQVSDAAHLAG